MTDDPSKTQAEAVNEHPAYKAVRAAFSYLKSTSLSTDKYKDFRVEEILLKDAAYTVTLSYDIEGEFGFDKKREYKEFEINKDFEVISMKIKKL